jgi:PAS domain S-box-containing protein
MSSKSRPGRTTKSRSKSVTTKTPGIVPGSPVRALSELSKRRSLKDALELSETRFALFMQHMPAATFIKNLNGHYVYFSENFADFTGRAPGIRPGMSDEESWPEFAQRLREEDRLVIQTGRTVTSEDCRTDGDKTRYFQTVKFPIPDQQGSTQLIGGISVDITERVEAERERRTLLEKVSHAQEEERWRISRELHDDLTQRLGTLAIDIGRIAEERPLPAKAHRASLRSLQQRVVEAAEAARHLVHELHPLELEDLGLVAALRAYCQDFSRREGIVVRLKSRDVPKRLKREIGSCVYKVAKESLSNVAMHAEAERVSVILEGAGDVIRLSVKDSGIGFTAGMEGAEGGMGLLGMKARVALVGGNIDIVSEPGQGTEVRVALPLELR